MIYYYSDSTRRGIAATVKLMVGFICLFLFCDVDWVGFERIIILVL